MNALTRRSLILSCAALAAGSLAATAEAAPAGIAIRIVRAGFIFGASVGSGTLRFQGQDYPLSIGGISAGTVVGASDADLVGTASNLNQPADIEGIYSAVGAGLAIAGGRTAAQLVNARGVVLKLHGRQLGLMFSLDLSGMSIALRR